MKIRLLSDLHLEFEPIDLSPIGEDLIILAGDIDVHLRHMEFAKKIARKFDVPVISILGNHEYYRHSWEDTIKEFAAAADHTDKIVKGEVTFLEDGIAEYEGIRFIGSTLWTDMKLFGDDPLVPWMIWNALADYQAIYSGDPHAATDRLTPEQTILRHGVSREFITNALHQPCNGPTVVVTHHAPSWLSIHEMYRADKVSAAFASRLESLILDTNPVLWCHGHVHSHHDYQIGQTRIVANPRGYPGEDAGFDPNLIIGV